jgi:hypothetical protein
VPDGSASVNFPPATVRRRWNSSGRSFRRRLVVRGGAARYLDDGSRIRLEVIEGRAGGTQPRSC